MDINDALIAKLTWRSDATHRYASALLRTAVALADRNVNYFNNDDIPEHEQPLDKTTVGVVFRMMAGAQIIEPFRGHAEQQQIWGGMRRSSRRCNNGHRNQVYRLTNRGIAAEWLRRHGAAPEPRQLTLEV